MSNERPKPLPGSTPADSGRSTTSPDQRPGKESAPEPQRDVSKLTAEEQMAAFEKDLKENDWGHQPC